MPSTVWGLDIGNSAVKAVKMVRAGDDVKIVDFDIIDMPEVEDDKQNLGRIEQAMRTLTTNHKFGNDEVYIAMAGKMCLYREFQLPPGSEEKLKDLVQYEARQQIPFPLEQVEWGYERFEDPNGVGVALIALRKNDIQDLLKMLTSLGLNVTGIVAAPMALFNFIHYEFHPANTTLILDAGAKSTDFVVMNKRQIYFRTIEIAGREITRVLENKFKVPFDKAEELKKNISQSPQAQKILGVIEPTLRQLGSEIQKTIGFYKSRAKGQRINQCYLLGHTFRLPSMAENLQALVREAPFAVVEGLQKVKLAVENTQVWANEFPTMAVAIGLGIQGLEKSELTLNLIPKSIEEQIRVAALKRWAAAAAALIAVTVGVSYVHATSNLTHYAEMKKDIETTNKTTMDLDNEEKAAIKGLDEKREMLERLARVGHDRGKIVQAFNRLTRLTIDGKPAFGEDSENKIYLTNLYISRIPFRVDESAEAGIVLPGGKGGNVASRRVKMSTPQYTDRYYKPLGNGGDPMALPPELRPDVPMLAIISGEYDNSTGRSGGPLDQVEKALKAYKEGAEIVEPTTSDMNENFIQPGEPTLKYKVEGGPGLSLEKSKEGADSRFLTFNAIMRWEDLSDRDRAPTPAAPAAPAAGNQPKKK
jgi:type IV pilus assembly protein PilM